MQLTILISGYGNGTDYEQKKETNDFFQNNIIFNLPFFRSYKEVNTLNEADLQKLLPDRVLENTALNERQYLLDIFTRFNGKYPGLQELWELMDQPWHDLGCDPEIMDDKIEKYYNHPIWLLNWLFIEQHKESQQHRLCFADWVANNKPHRVADYGGGGGGLARIIGAACPNAMIEIVEPHAHPAAIALTNAVSNVCFKTELTGEYDILIATDVFEHVPDPLELIAETTKHLKVNGQFLIANCFEPVILCHLPQTFHFRWSWETAMEAFGLIPGEKVRYGRAFQRQKVLCLDQARKIEFRSKQYYKLTKYLPAPVARLLTKSLRNTAWLKI